MSQISIKKVNTKVVWLFQKEAKRRKVNQPILFEIMWEIYQQYKMDAWK